MELSSRAIEERAAIIRYAFFDFFVDSYHQGVLTFEEAIGSYLVYLTRQPSPTSPEDLTASI